MKVRPVPHLESKLIMRTSSEGVTLYVNKYALDDIIKQLMWIKESDPRDHFELHTMMTMENDESKFGVSGNKNAIKIFDGELGKIISQNIDDHHDFDLTFMIIEDYDFEKMNQD
jgi:hypothetical protein